MTYGPTSEFSQQLHQEKYRGQGESFEEAMNRVAGALSDDSEHYQGFRDALLNMRFLPGGRIQAAMGSSKRVTAYNCFVSGVIEDSFVEGNGSIMDRAKEAAATMRMGGGIGYDFSTLRPRGAQIKKLDSASSGPVAFMDIFNSVCQCVASSGHRRGAQMGVLRVDHPDIEEFIHAKQNGTQLTGFNISVGVTDEFMRAVEKDAMFMLRWGGQEYREVRARDLWDNIMRSTYDWAEPGVLFLDRINQENNLWYCETITATNPCGEQPLPPYGACLLGSFNLVKYLVPTHDGHRFDGEQLLRDVPHVVCAMDNVIDRTVYPMYEQEKEAKNKRRMGLGVTGLANCLEALGYPYGSPKFLEYQAAIMKALRDTAYMSSVQLAVEKGAFPQYDANLYGERGFASGLPDAIRVMIKDHGIRNSHLLSIAPTGTISAAADNVSSGIEPVFAWEAERKVAFPDGERMVEVRDYGVAHLKHSR